MYAVMTWGDKMPASFPLQTSQNSGNMVHAKAPFSMFPNSVGLDYDFRAEGYSSFAEFANERCDAVIVPFANTLRTDPKDDARGASVAQSIRRFKVPVIPFGLGAQAETTDIDQVDLGPGMQEMIRTLDELCPAVSVRGDFTFAILKKYGTAENVHVTGCPSFFSRPGSFADLQQRLAGIRYPYRASFAGSLHHQETPKSQLTQAIRQDMFIVEPVNAHMHQFYLESVDGEPGNVPYFLKDFVKEEDWSSAKLGEFFVRRYRLFRDLESWIAFNKESVDGTIGTRFHVNMASLLSGVPACWITHDARTVELCDRLSLPSVTMKESLEKPFREIIQEADYGPLFANLKSNFDDFIAFLVAAGLPTVARPDP